MVKPDPKMQYNFNDPESRILKGPNGSCRAYNAQIALDPVLQLMPPGLSRWKKQACRRIALSTARTHTGSKILLIPGFSPLSVTSVAPKL